MAEPVRVGQIVGAFGIRGQVKVVPLVEIGDPLRDGARVRLKGHWVKIERVTSHKGRPHVKFEGIDDMTAAEALQWEFIEAIVAPTELEEDEYWTRDLVGLSVVTTEGEDLGTVKAVHAYPAQDVIEVGDILIPAVKQFVKSVDLDAKTIVVELIEGMR